MVCASTGYCPPGQRHSVLMWTLPVSLTAYDPGGMTIIRADSNTVAETNGDMEWKENHKSKAASRKRLLAGPTDGRTHHRRLSQSPSVTEQRSLQVSHTATLRLFVILPTLLFLTFSKAAPLCEPIIHPLSSDL